MITNNINMNNKEQIDKTTSELNEIERQILNQHTQKTVEQLNHYLNLKKQKLYLKKKLKKQENEQVKKELSDDSVLDL